MSGPRELVPTDSSAKWAYVRSYSHAYERTKAWLPTRSLNCQPPIRRLGLSLHNLSALHS